MHDVPYGCCGCGCGGKTSIAPRDRPDRGYVKGEPIRFIHGHHRRRARVAPVPKPCSRCGEVKPPQGFYDEASKYDGLSPVCKECVSAAAANWRRNNYDRSLELQRRCRDENRDRYRAYQRDRQQRERDAFVEVVDRLVVLEMDDGVCGICGGDVDPLDYHTDHIIPLARGGEDSYANVQVAHPACNRRKGLRLPEEMAT